MKNQGALFILLALGLLAVVALRAMTFLDGPARPDEALVENRPLKVREKGYVSSKTCESCHPHEHATKNMLSFWITSNNTTMFTKC
jgi:hypothetical protein